MRFLHEKLADDLYVSLDDRRKGKNIYYSLNKESLQMLEQTLHEVFSEKRIVYAVQSLAVKNDTNV